MYVTMRGFETGVKSHLQPPAVLSLIAAALVAVAVPSAHGSESTIELGGASGWGAVAVWENLRTLPGWHGGRDIVLQEAKPEVYPSTDLFLETEAGLFDAAGRYSVVEGVDSITDFHARHGVRSLHFDGMNRIVLRPDCDNALFGANRQIRSFTVEAWVFPMSTGDNATVFRWTGTRFSAAGVPRRQEFALRTRDRRLVWTLDNLFLIPEGGPSRIELAARSVLVPNQWRHHQLSFDGTTGKITYRVDGTPEAIAYANAEGRETGRSWYIHTGSECEDGFSLGDGFVGLVDDVRITGNALEEPSLLPYDGAPGVFTTDLIDLGSDGASIREIDLRSVHPGGTEVELYYRVGGRRLSWEAADALASTWQQVPENFQIFGGPTGRFLQIKAYLYPDAGRNVSPRVQNIVVDITHRPPPIPPQVVRAVSVAGGVHLSWSPAQSIDMAGYRVYLGEERGRYTGTDLVGSPIDVGAATEITFDSLEPGRPYVFAVESYDRYEQFSVLSREAEARAGRMEE